MKVDIKKLPKSEIELTITVPYSVYHKWEKRALADVNKEVKISGFRPGHAPESVVRERVGTDGLRQATLDYLLPQTYSEAVQGNKLEPVVAPKVDIKTFPEKEGDDFVYTATVAVMPEVSVGDYRKIKAPRKSAKVEPESVEKTVGMIMDRYAEWKDVEREAKKDDRAEITFEGFDTEGKAIANTASKNHPVILGSGAMVPGFEEAVMGMKKDEAKSFDITFPSDYHAKDMQGKKVNFKLTLNRLEEKQVKPLNEAMVEKITGEKKGVDDFKKLIEKDLEAEMDEKHRQEQENAIADAIIKITKAEVPEAMINDEVEAILEDQKKRVQRQGLQWEQFLAHTKKTEEDFRADHRKMAEERVLLRLGIRHIMADADIKVSDDEVQKKISDMAAGLPDERRQAIVDYYKNDEQAAERLRQTLAVDKLFALLSG